MLKIGTLNTATTAVLWFNLPQLNYPCPGCDKSDLNLLITSRSTSLRVIRCSSEFMNKDINSENNLLDIIHNIMDCNKSFHITL